MVETSKTSKNNSISAAQWSMVTIAGSIAAITIVAAPFLLIPASRKLGSLPWMVSSELSGGLWDQATPRSVIKQAIDHLSAQAPSDAVKAQRPRWLDLGSGDGRVCILAAQNGYHATGVELNPLLVALSYYNAYKANVPLSHVRFTMDNLWNLPLGNFQVISVFGVPSIMDRLNEKLHKEADPSSYIISYRFGIPNRKVYRKEGELYIYTNSIV
eukprot:gene33220-40194_t